MKVTLKIQTNDKVIEHTIPVNTSTVFGRSSKADCHVADDQMSGSHCRFHLKFDRLEITDLDSKNGTYLNGIRVERSEIFIGDEIKMGKTKITLLEEKMEHASVDLLTFPGPFKDRVNHELRVDFTGARIQNQLNHHKSQLNSPSHMQEIQLRKKIKSNIKLSKQEIRAKHKLQSNMAGIVDVGLVICIFLLPIVILNSVIQANGIALPGLHLNGDFIKMNKSMILIAAEVLGIGFFFFFNFKVFKFTIGEKISGIQSAYEGQG